MTEEMLLQIIPAESNMSGSADRESAATVAARRSLLSHSIFQRAISLARIWRDRERQRRQLLDYIASDHRAAADLGVSGYEARRWAGRPFWRP
ncbi:MAG: hypothetical protein WCA56_15830 [Xanthobacteraceae bacterium]